MLIFVRWEAVPGEGAVHYVPETLQQWRKVHQQLCGVPLPDCLHWCSPWRYSCLEKIYSNCLMVVFKVPSLSFIWAFIVPLSFTFITFSCHHNLWNLFFLFLVKHFLTLGYGCRNDIDLAELLATVHCAYFNSAKTTHMFCTDPVYTRYWFPVSRQLHVQFCQWTATIQCCHIILFITANRSINIAICTNKALCDLQLYSLRILNHFVPFSRPSPPSFPWTRRWWSVVTAT